MMNNTRDGGGTQRDDECNATSEGGGGVAEVKWMSVTPRYWYRLCIVECPCLWFCVLRFGLSLGVLSWMCLPFWP